MKIISFVTGLGVGAVVAMLLTPRSGDEMREMLSEKAEDGRRYAKKRVRELSNVANEVAERGREAMEHQKHAITAAAQVAKDTYNRESQMRAS
jgi:gas vesicle protein